MRATQATRVTSRRAPMRCPACSRRAGDRQVTTVRSHAARRASGARAAGEQIRSGQSGDGSSAPRRTPSRCRRAATGRDRGGLGDGLRASPLGQSRAGVRTARARSASQGFETQPVRHGRRRDGLDDATALEAGPGHLPDPPRRRGRVLEAPNATGGLGIGTTAGMHTTRQRSPPSNRPRSHIAVRLAGALGGQVVCWGANSAQATHGPTADILTARRSWPLQSVASRMRLARLRLTPAERRVLGLHALGTLG